MGDPIDPLDLLDVGHLLTAEERQIRDLVREWVRDNVLADVGGWFEAGGFPRGAISQLGGLGLLGMDLDGYGWLGGDGGSYGVACLELEGRGSGVRSVGSVQGSLWM